MTLVTLSACAPKGEGMYGNLLKGGEHFTLDPKTLPDKIAVLQ